MHNGSYNVGVAESVHVKNEPQTWTGCYPVHQRSLPHHSCLIMHLIACPCSHNHAFWIAHLPALLIVMSNESHVMHVVTPSPYTVHIHRDHFLLSSFWYCVWVLLSIYSICHISFFCTSAVSIFSFCFIFIS